MRRQRIKQKTYKKQVEENKKYSRKDGEKMEQTKKERIWRKKGDGNKRTTIEK